jgi:hypothetical protein
MSGIDLSDSGRLPALVAPLTADNGGAVLVQIGELAIRLSHDQYASLVEAIERFERSM